MADEVIDMQLVNYTDEDAKALGIPTAGAMNMMRIYVKQVAGTPLAPKALIKDNMNPQQVQNTLFAAVMTGQEMGFTPMQALRSYWLSPDGRLGMYADAMLAAMRAKGFRFTWIQNDANGCIATAKRPYGNGEWEEYTSTYTVEMAIQAGLYHKDRSVWQRYPDRMCKWRVIGDTFRTLASDLGGGQMYAEGELDDKYLTGETPNTTPNSLPAGKADDTGAYTVELKAQPADPPPPAATVTTAPVSNVEHAAPESTARIMLATETTKGEMLVSVMNRQPVPFSQVDAMKADAQALANEHNATYVIIVAEANGKETEWSRLTPAPKAAPAATTAPAATAAPTEAPAPKSPLSATIDALAKEYFPGKNEKTTKARFGTFMEGYTGRKAADLLKTEQMPFFEPIIAALKCCLLRDKVGFEASPAATGSKMAHIATLIREYATQTWNDPNLPDILVNAMCVTGMCVAENADTAFDNIKTKFIEPNYLQTMTASDVTAALRVISVTDANLSTDARKAFRITVNVALTYKVPAEKLVSRIMKVTGKFVADCTPAELLAAANGLEEWAKAEPAPAPAPEPEPPAPTEPEKEEGPLGSLFD
jgi:hypothetical protein